MNVKCGLFILLFFSFYNVLAHAGTEDDLSSLLTALQRSMPDTNRTNIYKAISERYQVTNQDSAYNFATRGLLFARSINDKKGQSAMLNIAGEIDMAKGMYNKAQQNYTEALSIDKQLENTYAVGTDLLRLGHALINKGDHANATEHYLGALKMFEHCNNAKGQGAAYMALGMMYEQLNENQKALEYLYRSQNALQGIPFTITNVQVMNNIGLLYNNMKLYDTSLAMLNKGLAASTTPEYVVVRIQLLSNKSMVLSETGHTKEAIENMDESLALARKMHLRLQESYGLVNRASLMKDRPALAIAQMKEALGISQEIGEKHLEAGIYGSLAEFYEANKQFAEALDATKKQNSIQDSLQDAKKKIAVADLVNSYKLEKADDRVTYLTAINSRNIFRTRLIFTVTLGIAFILAIVGFYYRRTTLLNKQLVQQGNELKQLNIVATAQREELKGVNTEKDKIFSILGHDLRSPLSNITATLRLLERDNSGISEENSRYINKLKAQTSVTMDTLDKLLYWGKNSFKGIDMAQQTFAANPVVQSNIALLLPVAQQKEITLSNSLPDNVMLFADPSHFDFVVRNLISNALKFTSAGGTIDIATTASDKDGLVVFAVRDNGVGMNAEELTQLFTIDNAGKAGTQEEIGTGIGLLLCKEFVQKNGGDIWVTSKQNEGTVFYFSFKELV